MHPKIFVITKFLEYPNITSTLVLISYWHTALAVERQATWERKHVWSAASFGLKYYRPPTHSPFPSKDVVGRWQARSDEVKDYSAKIGLNGWQSKNPCLRN